MRYLNHPKGYEESAELLNNLIQLRDNVYVNNAQNLKRISQFEKEFIDKFQTKSRYLSNWSSENN